MTEVDTPVPEQPWFRKKTTLIGGSSILAFGLLVAGGFAASAAIGSSHQAAVPTFQPTHTSAAPKPTHTPTATPTPTPTAAPTAQAGGTGSGSTGGGSGGTGSGSGGSGGGGVVAPPPSPPPPSPPAPHYTDAEVRSAVVAAYGAVPVYDNCVASNYGTFGGSGGLGTPPPPVYVGILGYDAGALADGSGGWVNYYSCE